MVTFLTILALVAAILLILIVLIQKPKGGGITNNLTGGANQIFGAKKTSDIVEKATWFLSGAIAVILLVSSVFNPSNTSGEEDVQDLDPSKEIEKALDNPGAVKKPSINMPTTGNNGGASIQQAPPAAQEEPTE